MLRRINKLRCLKNPNSLVSSLAQQAAQHPLCASIKKMHQQIVLSCLICLAGLIGSIHAADKYTDENRPYEFGFTIEGEQHRHEKKDENGIIMGEFGFITADGVYHVTVYATDEQGRFKILSMKNIRVKPYPTTASSGASIAKSTAASNSGVKKGHSIQFPPSANSPVLQGPSSAKTAENSNSQQQGSISLATNKQISSPAKSCSHCSIPTTTTKAPPLQLTDIAIVSKDRSIPETSGLVPPNNYQQNIPLSSSRGQNNYSPQQTNTFSPRYGGNNPQNPQVNYQQDSFENVQQNNQQQDFSRSLNSPSSAPKVDYSQENNRANSNIPQSNKYYTQAENNFKQNNFGTDENGPQINFPNRNSGDQYYNQENGNYPQRQGDGNVNYPQQQPNYVPSESSSLQPSPAQDYNNNLQTPNLRNPKQYNDVSSPSLETGLSQGFREALASQPYQPVSNRPTLVAAQMQIVPKDTDIYHRGPGEQEGLPSGLSKDDMTHLLYTFNYTVGFHGHSEEGYSNGAKKGYYYVTGRNGIRTRVDYVADEKGFRPTITQEVLDVLSDDVPKEETEKDEKYGLKGYEFKWLYYPTSERK